LLVKKLWDLLGGQAVRNVGSLSFTRSIDLQLVYDEYSKSAVKCPNIHPIPATLGFPFAVPLYLGDTHRFGKQCARMIRVDVSLCFRPGATHVPSLRVVACKP
jgi:hypothetical protein